jgi:hypothetical protein
VTPAELVGQVYDAVRHYALDHPMVLHAALDLTGRVGSSARNAALRLDLGTHLGLMLNAYDRTSPQDHDLQRLRDRLEPVRQNVMEPPREA